MANPEHLAILKKGWKAWNRWRGEPDQFSPDLCNANLRNRRLREVDFRGADLRGADLTGAYLYYANFIDADLSNAKFHFADLTDATLRDANLCGANLSYANLSRATFKEADFTEAQFSYSTLANVDLSRAKGLETVRHTGPSTIGIDTIYRSHGQIPEVFLRGCGVPDNFIAYAKSLTGSAIEFYSCFISYSTKDQAFAERLHADLQAKGVRCWFAPHDVQAGRKLHEQIDEAIRLHDKLR